jgi:hypothetical protein
LSARNRTPRRAAAPGPGRRLERLGKSALKVLLQGSAIDTEGSPAAHVQIRRGRSQQRIGQRHRLAHAAPERDMKFADHRDPQETSPRYAARDAPTPRSDFRHMVLCDEVVRPLAGRVNRK